ncbi:MAG TPA: NifU family protein [Acidimicrobiia bacterium]|nr:NifU family protein [Acidimicrobiia bacterium]
MTEQQLTDQVIVITDHALEKILELRQSEPQGDTLGLRIEVTGVRGLEYQYDLAFEPADSRSDTDVVTNHGDLPVVIPAQDVDKLRGATLDLPTAAGQGGLVLRNPNSPSPLAGGADGGVDLQGTVEERLRQLLDTLINPSIAGHGGFAELVAVEEETAYLRLGGGCQGCGLAQVTLSQGIEQAIYQHVPEIRQVVDVTDHASGSNPYFEPSAK